MNPPVKATQKQYERAIELYEQGGASAVYHFAWQEGITSWSFCLPCEAQTPDCEEGWCLVCGSAKEPSMNRWIVVVNTMCDGTIPAYWTDDKPVTYATLREANLEVVDTIRMHLDNFVNNPGEEEINLPDDYVVPCTVLEDGTITTECEGVLWDPKKPASEYGR